MDFKSFASRIIKSQPFRRFLLRKGVALFFIGLFSINNLACNPSTTNNYLTANGADKKLPDDDGYTGSGGTGDGGGGQGILCGSNVSNSQIRSKLFVRDIFEAVFNSKISIKRSPLIPNPSSGIADEEIHFLLTLLKRYFGPSLVELEIGHQQFWKDFYSKIAFVEKDVRLNVSRDANSPILLPEGCKIVQIAYWDDSQGSHSNGILYVDKALWDQLDSENRMALLAHEYFFKEARLAGFKNSDFVRSRIGQLFSEIGPEAIFSEWTATRKESPTLPKDPESYKFCIGSIENDPTASLHLYFYDSNKLVIPYLRSKRISISSLQPFNFIDSQYKIGIGMDLAYLAQSAYLGQLEGDSLKTIFQSSPENYGSKIYSLKFFLQGATSSFNGPTNPAVILKDILPRLANNSIPLWTGTKSSSNSVLRFEFENPVSLANRVSENGIDDANSQLFRVMIYNIGKKMETAKKDRKLTEKGSITTSDEQVARESMNLYAVLNAEISEYISRGEYPNSWPKWTTALQALSSKIFLPTEGPYIQDFLTSMREFPELFYMAKTKVLTKDHRDEISDMYQAVMNDLDPYSPPHNLKRGFFSVKKDNEEVTFQLSCEDIGSKVTKEKNDFLLKHFKRLGLEDSEVELDIDPLRFPIVIRNFKPISSRSLKEDAQRFLKNLKNISEDKEAHYNSCNIRNSHLINPSCPLGEISLWLRLQRTSNVKVLPCTDYQWYRDLDSKEFPKENNLNCKIFYFKEDDSAFLIAEKSKKLGSSEGGFKVFEYLVRPVLPQYVNMDDKSAHQ